MFIRKLFIFSIAILFFFSCNPEEEKTVIAITVKSVQDPDAEVSIQWGSAFYSEDDPVPNVSLGDLKTPYIQRIEREDVAGQAFAFRVISDTLLDVTIKVNSQTAYQSQGKEHSPKTEIILRKYD